jgi:hypothetical protein
MGRQLLLELGPLPVEVPLVMGCAYESNETRQLVLELSMIPMARLKRTDATLGISDRALYKERNQAERFFRPLKGFRGLVSRFERTRCCVSRLRLFGVHRRGSEIR